mgnify:CR=1 FL=1
MVFVRQVTKLGDVVDKPCRGLRKDAERNRQRIIEAARELFAVRGLEATLNDVAHHANVGVGTVYRRFPDKEALVEALFTELQADAKLIGPVVDFARRAENAPDVLFAWSI